MTGYSTTDSDHTARAPASGATSRREITVVKLHGLGNDFLVHLAYGTGLGAAEGAHLAERLCRRHEGIGADGLIEGLLRSDGALVEGAISEDTRMSFRLWNADGSEAEMSGNGIRCLAHAALDEGWVDEVGDFGVETPAGRRLITARRTSDPATVWAEVGMGFVKIGGDEQRCNVGHGQLFIDVGNPHLVVLGPDPANLDVARLGPLLEATEPDGINVEFVTLGPGPDTVTMRVWERGVGETRACGTGACAAAAAMHQWGRVGTAVTVNQPGGSAAVTLNAEGSASLAGPSVRVATCQVAL
jgi:diaminopimelate epimerase